MMNNNDDVMETEKDDAMMEGLETPFDGDADAGVTADGSDDAVEKRRWPKWLVPVIVVACVVALMAGGAAWYLIDSNRRAQARGACEQGVTSVTADKAAWEKLLKADDTIAASKVTSDQVADSATVETLTDLLAETTDLKIVACDADATADLEAVTAALATTAEWYQGQTKKIDEAVAAVTSSRDAKTLATARDALVKKVDEARSLLSKSDGSVADDSTRDALGKAIDEADKGKDDKDPSMLDGLREKLVSAMQAVSDSRDAKARADEEAAAQAKRPPRPRLKRRPSSSTRPRTRAAGTPVADTRRLRRPHTPGRVAVRVLLALAADPSAALAAESALAGTRLRVVS